jgi:hypothetical protein
MVDTVPLTFHKIRFDKYNTITKEFQKAESKITSICEDLFQVTEDDYSTYRKRKTKEKIVKQKSMLSNSKKSPKRIFLKKLRNDICESKEKEKFNSTNYSNFFSQKVLKKSRNISNSIYQLKNNSLNFSKNKFPIKIKSISIERTSDVKLPAFSLFKKSAEKIEHTKNELFHKPKFVEISNKNNFNGIVSFKINSKNQKLNDSIQLKQTPINASLVLKSAILKKPTINLNSNRENNYSSENLPKTKKQVSFDLTKYDEHFKKNLEILKTLKDLTKQKVKICRIKRDVGKVDLSNIV